MTAINNFLHTMNHGFMTVNCGPGIDPFISIKFVNLERAHAAHRSLIALAIVARDSESEKCAKCGCYTKGEAALVDGAIWCHPCADNADLYKMAVDLDEQFKSASGEVGSLRLALLSMMHADSEQLKGMAQRILDRSRERWPPKHKPFTSIAILEDNGKPSASPQLEGVASVNSDAREAEDILRLTTALEQAIDHLVRLDAFVDGQGFRPSIRGTVALGRAALSRT
jgi:hypothetical protein